MIVAVVGYLVIGLVVVLALCRAAKKGDRQLRILKGGKD